MVRLGVLLGALCLAWVGCGDDSGSDNDNQDNQNNQNTSGECGDGTVDPGEACDDGAANSDAIADACRTDCRLPSCGDGVADSVEDCDDGGDNSDTEPGACRTDCRAAHCQDGVLDPSEGCDDGNDVAGDGCAPDCTVEDHWACDGSPSVCGCADYYWGPGCGACAVRVKSDVLGVLPTGASWEAAFTTVQEGIDLADAFAHPCEVWVAGGTYRVWDSNVDDSVYMRSGVSLYGGFAGTEIARDQRDWHANPTVLDGMREGSTPMDGDYVHHVVTAFETQDATLDGFVVTGGHVPDGGTEQTSSGGGMLVYQFTGTTDVGVANCVFHDNRAYRYGGAIAVFGSALRVVSSAFYGNEANQHGGAIAGRTNTAITVIDSTLSHNVVICGSTASCSGGGIYADASVDLYVQSSLFYANLAQFPANPSNTHGAGIHGNPNAVVRSCTFARNVASNTAFGAGSALYEAGEVTNCVFDGNSGGALANGGAVTYSQVESFTIGAENSTADPLLVRMPTAVYHALMLGDQGLSMSDPTVLAVGDVVEVDNDGVPRTITSVSPPEFVFFSPTGGTFRAGYVVVENWGQGATTVEEDLSLQPTSPCIDTANDAAAPPTDLHGNPRVDVTGVGTAGTLSDRGAIEYQP